MAVASSHCHMKPLSLCPKCGQQFSRKWNMREHCRTQHHYDPDPNPSISPIGQRKTMELMDSSGNATTMSKTSAPVEKFLRTMANAARFQQKGTKDDTGEDSLGTIEYSLNYILDNFVIISKKEFRGISGFYCKKCLTFEYRYIRNLGGEKTAKDKHVHSFNLALDGNRDLKETELRIQAENVLIELTNSLFGAYKKIDVQPCVAHANIQGPVLKYDSLESYQWAGIAIMNNGLTKPTNEYINEFIISVEGTYAQIIVATGALKGKYLISIQSAR